MGNTASLEDLVKHEYRSMVCTMPFGDITVSELCSRVGISRKSFYAHFENRDEVLARIIYDDIGAPVEKIFPLFRTSNVAVSVPLMNTMVYRSLLEHKEFYLRLVIYDDIGAPVEKIFPLFRTSNVAVSVPLMNTMVYRSLLEHKEFYLRLVTQNQERIFVHAFQRCLMGSHEFASDTLGGKKGEEYLYASRFLAAAQAAIVMQWIRTGMELPPEQLSEWFSVWSEAAVQSIAWGEGAK